MPRSRRRTLTAVALLVLAAPPAAGAAPAWTPGQTVTSSHAFATDGFGLSYALVQQRFSNDLWFRERPAGPAGVFAGGTMLTANVTDEERLLAEADGDLLAVWTSSQYDLHVAERPRGGAWAGPRVFTTDARLVDVDLRPDGRAAIAWNDGGAVHATWRTGPGTWVDPVEVSATHTGVPKVAVAPDGAITVVWRQTHPDHGHVVMQRTKPAGSDAFAAAQRLSSGAHPTDPGLDDGHAHDPSVEIGPDGRAFAAWSHDAGYCTDHANVPQCPGGGSEVEKIEYAERPAGATTFGAPLQAAVGELDLNETPALAMADDGSVTMLYRRDISANGIVNEVEENALVALTRPAGAAGFTRQVLTQDGSRKDLVAGPGGHVYAAWQTRGAGGGTITRAARRAPGAATFSAVAGESAERGNSGYELSVSREGDLLHWNGPLEVVDAAGPRITSFTAPAEVVAGRPATLRVDAVDTWSALSRIEWDLPGGATAEGAEIAHTFADEGEQTVTITATDAHGNATTRTETVDVAPPPDEQAPQIEITTPAIGQRFKQGQVVEAAYSCTDDRAVATCEGTVADGARLDTSRVGQHTLRVVARDTVGHETTRSHGYFVDALAQGEELPPPVTRQQPAPEAPRGDTPATPLPEIVERDAQQNGGTAPPAVSGSTLLGGGLSQIISATQPGTSIIGQISGVISAGGGNVISAGGGNVISAGGGNVISAGGGNVISAGGGNVISAGGGNVISAGGGNVISAGGGNLIPRAAAAARSRTALLGDGGHTFAEPGTAMLRVELNAEGRRLLAAARREARRDRRRGRKVRDLELSYSVITGRRDGATPAYVATKVVKIELAYRFIQTRGRRNGLGYDVIRHRNGKPYRHYENGDVVLKR